MQAILKPKSSAELAEIIINGSLFAVGRDDPPFARYPAQWSAELSRRHARIFEQQGMVYLVDLGSRRGTTVDGRRVEKVPVALKRGDEICFGRLCYEIEILGTANRGLAKPAPSPVRLVLNPQDPDAGLERIVVAEFPFLISKSSRVFAQYATRLPADLNFISRRHAHIFLRDGEPFIEDLGSTNGTYLDGVRLGDAAQRLSDGNRVAFGGDRFIYSVQVERQDVSVSRAPDGPMQATVVLRTVEDLSKTTFVTSADSFLEIFCCEEKDPEKEAPTARPEASGAREGGAEKPLPGWRGLMKRSLSLARQVRQVLREEDKARPAGRWIALAALSAIGAIALGLYLSTATERDITNRMERGDYWGAAAAANRYLAGHPNDRDIGAQADEALTKAVVPAWMNQVAAGQFDAAEQALARGKALCAFNPSGQALLDLLGWVTSLERFIKERGGIDAPVVMFEQEAQINGLIKRWEADSTEQRHRLEAITRYVPPFSAVRAEVFSHLRTLRSQQALDLAAIKRLVKTVSDTLAEGDPKTLPSVLNDFAAHYPRIAGLDKLRDDLACYLRVEAARNDENLLEAQRLARESQFQTKPFRARIELLLKTALPSDAFVARYDRAREAWRQGRLDEAIAALEGLAQGPWGQVAKRQLQHDQKLKADYERLLAGKGQAGYEDRLLEFHKEVSPTQDVYFVEALANDFRVHRAMALKEAQSSFVGAQQAWEKYQSQGGIDSFQRLAGNVSSQFRASAGSLSRGYQRITHAVAVYELLGMNPPADWQELKTQITNEVRLQRRSLAELAMVLEPALRKAKLDLLPTSQALAGGNEGVAPTPPPAESLPGQEGDSHSKSGDVTSVSTTGLSDGKGR
jgi:pSer/pThr/pTyr-binding forkhead associated (FHA) protein